MKKILLPLLFLVGCANGPETPSQCVDRLMSEENISYNVVGIDAPKVSVFFFPQVRTDDIKGVKALYEYYLMETESTRGNPLPESED